jgi:hypothetical protein
LPGPEGQARPIVALTITLRGEIANRYRRYISATDTVTPPLVRIAAPTAAARLDLIAAPGEAPDVLRGPGGAVALVSGSDTELTTTVVRHSESTSAAVELHLELLAPQACGLH